MCVNMQKKFLRVCNKRVNNADGVHAYGSLSPILSLAFLRISHLFLHHPLLLFFFHLFLHMILFLFISHLKLETPSSPTSSSLNAFHQTRASFPFFHPSSILPPSVYLQLWSGHISAAAQKKVVKLCDLKLSFWKWKVVQEDGATNVLVWAVLLLSCSDIIVAMFVEC